MPTNYYIYIRLINHSEKLMRAPVIIFLLLILPARLTANESTRIADSLRRAFHIPGLSYAVVSPDSVLEIQALGESKLNSGRQLTLQNKFRIGSNTKAITGIIAARLVKEGRIAWDSRFFDLFPELRPGTRKEYLNLTLLDLLTFRTKLFPYTYTDAYPSPDQISGSREQQRLKFIKWIFRHDPVQKDDSINFSNPGYVAAGMMLEKASGTTYADLVNDLAHATGIEFAFGPPNLDDSLQTWGHDQNSQPESAVANPKLDWLQAAGNINTTLPDYAKFIQINLAGLRGQSQLLSESDFRFLHFGRPRFAVGWHADLSDSSAPVTWHTGNPGTYLSKVRIYHRKNIAIIIFTNIQSREATEGIELLMEYLENIYCRI